MFCGHKIRMLAALALLTFVILTFVPTVESAESKVRKKDLTSHEQAIAPLHQAMRIGNIAHRGVRSSIVTGNPTLRNDPTGKWSYMRKVRVNFLMGKHIS